MRSILIIAATVVTLASCFIPERLRETTHMNHHKEGHRHHCKHHNPTTSEMSISLDRERLNELMRDFEDFGVTYWDKTRDEREVVIEGLKEAWANTAAKLIFNFGKSVAPVAEEWATIMQYVQVNPECNQKCAVKCLNPRKRETMYFDTKCLASCNCQFDIGKIRPEKVKAMAKNLESTLDETSDFYEARIREFKDIV